MTSEQVVGIIIVGLVLALIGRRRKRPPRMMFIETFEVIRERPKSPVLMNLAIVAAVALIIWAVAH